ncbi:hypothetical protein LCGC14_0307750 [marine sediment metagenome]|uniref:Uncharacterized protein n=1 Tax=marine sediment metagenome TaxID=412755 RepID=A0A0F9WUN3_9ZZZZ
MHEAGIGPLQKLGLRPTEHARPGWAHGCHHAAEIGACQHVLRQRPQSVSFRSAFGDAFLERPVQLAQARLALLQSALREDTLGDVVAADEDTRHVASLVSDGLEEEVDEAVGVVTADLDRQRASRERFSRRVDAVEKVYKALPFQLWKHLPNGVSDELAGTGKRHISIVDVLVAVLRARQHRHETRHLLEKEPLPPVGVGLPPLRHNFAGCLDAGAEQAGHRAVVVGDRSVGEREVRFFWITVPVERQLKVVHVNGIIREDTVHQRADLVAHLWPDVEEGTAKRIALPRAEHRRIALVVDEGAVRPPGHKHRLTRVEQHPDQSGQGLGPCIRRPEGRRLPVVGAEPLSHLAASEKEGDRHGLY